jgi:hypothetical protein
VHHSPEIYWLVLLVNRKSPDVTSCPIVRRLLSCREAAMKVVWTPESKQAVPESHGVVIKIGTPKTLV